MQNKKGCIKSLSPKLDLTGKPDKVVTRRLSYNIKGQVREKMAKKVIKV